MLCCSNLHRLAGAAQAVGAPVLWSRATSVSGPADRRELVPSKYLGPYGLSASQSHTAQEIMFPVQCGAGFSRLLGRERRPRAQDRSANGCAPIGTFVDVLSELQTHFALRGFKAVDYGFIWLDSP